MTNVNGGSGDQAWERFQSLVVLSGARVRLPSSAIRYCPACWFPFTTVTLSTNLTMWGERLWSCLCLAHMPRLTRVSASLQCQLSGLLCLFYIILCSTACIPSWQAERNE